ncbi:MAG: BMP family ABC transporter substrate-binding protein [Spirochaetaceae bacterium]|jgi:simple sugar transport system substrate-binding protein|nr:BMP family ABC transporter substrate-binding protein [Spirochaetaceae bacterium]
MLFLMAIKNKKLIFCAFCAGFAAVLLMSCAPKREKANVKSIAVFIPGMTAGSPIYSELVSGARQAVGERADYELLVVEAGYNQAEWEDKLTLLTAGGKHDLIVSSNPSMPFFVETISKKFPEQRFLLMDAQLAANPAVYTLCYNQREQGFMAGYLAGLLSSEASAVGLIAAQEYPALTEVIKPAFLEGAAAASGEVGKSPSLSLSYSVIGNWFDAQKAAELAGAMINSGVKVILPVAGSASEGVVQKAAESGAKVIWFDSNGYSIRPGVIAGSCALLQKNAVYDKLNLYFKGELPFGEAETVGVRDGYVQFIEDDPLYLENTDPLVREKQSAMINQIKEGLLILD